MRRRTLGRGPHHEARRRTHTRRAVDGTSQTPRLAVRIRSRCPAVRLLSLAPSQDHAVPHARRAQRRDRGGGHDPSRDRARPRTEPRTSRPNLASDRRANRRSAAMLLLKREGPCATETLRRNLPDVRSPAPGAPTHDSVVRPMFETEIQRGASHCLGGVDWRPFAGYQHQGRIEIAAPGRSGGAVLARSAS